MSYEQSVAGADRSPAAIHPALGASFLDEDIRALNLEGPAFKACVEEGWDLDTVDRADLEYRVFLQAIRDNPGVSLAPSKLVDAFWHHHILDTQAYIEDCDRLFGEYVHHFPYAGIRSEDDARQQDERFQRSQEIFKSTINRAKG